MLDKGLQVLSGEHLQVGTALTSQKCEEGEKEGDAAFEGAGLEVEPILMAEISFSMLCSRKVVIGKPFYPLLNYANPAIVAVRSLK